jgi:hypothetical protein
MTDSNKPSQKSLEDTEEIDKTLQELGKWLQKVRFEPAKMENSENCQIVPRLLLRNDSSAR